MYRLVSRAKSVAVLATVALCLASSGEVRAQLAPTIGYVFPPGGQAGTTFDAVLGGYDWTPDMQVFPHDARIKIEWTGPRSPILVPPPPYWFGAKGRGEAWPLPREYPVRITIPADFPVGMMRWQAANANGGSPLGQLHVSNLPEFVESPERTEPQRLPGLPVVVSGQIRKIEEVDRYLFHVDRPTIVSAQLIARRLGSPLHGMLKVVDPTGRTVVDAAGSEGDDLTVSFAATPGIHYELKLHDLDFAGDRSYVYRLQLTTGPRVVAAFPAAGKRGATQRVEFIGWGLETGQARLETVARDVAFPATAGVDQFDYALETPHGRAAPFTLGIRETTDLVEPAGARGMAVSLPAPEVATASPATPPATMTTQATVAVTGAIEDRFGADAYTVELAKGAKYRIAAESRKWGVPLDLNLTIFGPDGKQLVTQDDMPTSADPELLWTAPADGVFRIELSDRSGHSGSRAAWYRLVLSPDAADFRGSAPPVVAALLGGVAKLDLKFTRAGGFKEPLHIQLQGLPEGVTTKTELTVPADKSDLSVELQAAADAPAAASLVTIKATGTINGSPVVRELGPTLVAVTLKPRCKITPEGLDDVRKVSRGSTFLGPVFIERLEGYDGPVTLEMTSRQQRHRQGLASEDLVVTAGVTRYEYPIFIPEWMETTKTSRMILNGVVQVKDPRGVERTLVQKMELRIGVLPQGALMKLSHAVREPAVRPGEALEVPVQIARAPEFRDAVRVELVLDSGSEKSFSAAPLELTDRQTDGVLRIQTVADQVPPGEYALILRATAYREGRWLVKSETSLLVTVR